MPVKKNVSPKHTAAKKPEATPLEAWRGWIIDLHWRTPEAPPRVSTCSSAMQRAVARALFSDFDATVVARRPRTLAEQAACNTQDKTAGCRDRGLLYPAAGFAPERVLTAAEEAERKDILERAHRRAAELGLQLADDEMFEPESKAESEATG